MTEWKPSGMIVGVDAARPGSDRTVYGFGGRLGGKRALIDRMVEAHLDAGHTVMIPHVDGTYEIRGADQARDITPKTRLIP